MPVFSQSEYRDFQHRPTLEEAWKRLPVVADFDGLGARWLGPLVDLGHDVWLGDLSQAGWGFLEGCGWTELLPESPMLDDNGEPRDVWKKNLAAAARLLAERGLYSGPEGDPERWLSWLCVELSEPRSYVEGLARAKGCDH